jgi:hypothetical protein
MQQIKIFKGVENELGDLESRVNAWLADNNIRIINSFGNIAPQSESHRDGGLSRSYTPSDILIIFVYEKA